MRPADLHRAVIDWFDANARPLPWREPGTSAWAVLVSEVMSQQTPVARVEPAWRAWMDRWPTPEALAAASPADVLRAWDRLGYPRRALRLRECASAVVARHGGVVPVGEEDLLALPGIGAYTAAAVAAFAHGQRAVVLDTNVRRVLVRVADGVALPSPSLTRAETARAEALVPEEAEESARWNAAVMELGALVCTARSPDCGACPVSAGCRWLAAGRPADAHAARRRQQPWEGTDRQVRGRLMAVLRALPAGAHIGRSELLAHGGVPTGGDAEQAGRALDSLVRDGLVAQTQGTHDPRYALP
ncbi:A/G-specific adenine glycosylase [Georgenia wangjunii]|uniref:A/G-specific adenine glycosylase n=1 Tax=Georgenia wangjunii TaxID=3117730 RepID=UPI002F25F203